MPETDSRRLNAAQYDENCQKWTKLNFKLPGTAIFFANFDKLIRYSKSEYETAIGKCRGQNFERKSEKAVFMLG